jgi:hypothetical protein
MRIEDRLTKLLLPDAWFKDARPMLGSQDDMSVSTDAGTMLLL